MHSTTNPSLSAPNYQTYGRRRSRGWGEGQTTRMAEDLPKYTVLPEQCTQHADVAPFFQKPVKEYWLEIGFGQGEHLVTFAKNQPHRGIIGAEVYQSGVVVALEKTIQDRVGNVRFYSGDARQLLDAFPERSFHGVILLFPDPWPKARHEKRRLFNDTFVSHTRRLLKPNGVFRFASDALRYAEKVQNTLVNAPGFTLNHRWESPQRPDTLEWPLTRYEQKALAKGVPCTYLEFIHI